MIKIFLTLFACILFGATIQAQTVEFKKGNADIDHTKKTLIKKCKDSTNKINKGENATNRLYHQIKNLDYSSGKYVYFQVIVPELKAIKKYQEDHIT